MVNWVLVRGGVRRVCHGLFGQWARAQVYAHGPVAGYDAVLWLPVIGAIAFSDHLPSQRWHYDW